MIRGIHHVAINTANIERMRDFYMRAFGFVSACPQYGWSDSPFVDSIIGVAGSAARSEMLRAGNVYLELFQYSSPPARGDAPLRPNDHGYTHFALDTDDIDADYTRLTEAGMVFTRTVPDDMGGLRSVYGKDPDGNVIELQQLDAGHDFSLSHCKIV